jgi:hypothetical protein
MGRLLLSQFLFMGLLQTCTLCLLLMVHAGYMSMNVGPGMQMHNNNSTVNYKQLIIYKTFKTLNK